MKTIIFDFGNVLAFFDHMRAMTQLAHFTDISPAELMLQLYGGSIEDGYEVGKMSTDEFVRQSKLNGRLTCSNTEFLTSFVDIFWRNDDVCDLIPRLKPRYRLVLASNTNDGHFTHYCQQFADVLKHFEFLGASHQAGFRKPDAGFFAYCQRFAEAAPRECLFVDDLAVNIEAAERHGWRGVCYRPGTRLEGLLRSVGVELA